MSSGLSIYSSVTVIFILTRRPYPKLYGHGEVVSADRISHLFASFYTREVYVSALDHVFLASEGFADIFGEAAAVIRALEVRWRQAHRRVA